MLTIALLFIISGIILMVLAVPMIRGWIKPNPFYGFRIPRTMKNAALWYPVNRHAGQRLFVAGLCFTIAAVGLFFVPGIPLDVYSTLCTLVFVIVSAVGMIQTWRYMNRLPD